jgi:hypothetical protein
VQVEDSKRSIAAVVFGLTVACGAAPDGPDTQASSETLNVFEVCPPLPEESGIGLASWPAIRWPGVLVSVADETEGYVATFRIGGKWPGDCSHCPGPDADAELVHGQFWPDLDGVPPGQVCLTGVGPVAAPLLTLRLKELSIRPRVWEKQSPSEWQPSLEIDLDGDGQADLERVERCDRVIASGCGQHICDRTCSGVRRARDPENRANFVQCSSYIPDMLDCPPI